MATTIFGEIKKTLKASVLPQLPDKGVPNRIYYIPNGTTGDNKYDEYLWIKDEEHPDGYFERVGQKDIDLSNYLTKQDASLTYATIVSLQAEQQARTQGDADTLESAKEYTDNKETALNISITEISNNLQEETNNRTKADTTLQSNIDSEKANREAADIALQTNINAEATTRDAADIQLQKNIESESTARQTADTQLQTNISNEATARQQADTALEAKIPKVQQITYEEYLALSTKDANTFYVITNPTS